MFDGELKKFTCDNEKIQDNFYKALHKEDFEKYETPPRWQDLDGDNGEKFCRDLMTGQTDMGTCWGTDEVLDLLWQELTDPVTKEKCYLNTVTKQSQDEKPDDFSTAVKRRRRLGESRSHQDRPIMRLSEEIQEHEASSL